MMVKPMKTLELHYPMIQFFITKVSRGYTQQRTDPNTALLYVYMESEQVVIQVTH